MSYLQDKSIKRKKIKNIAIWVILLSIIFYFKTPIFNGFAYVTGAIFRPILSAGGNVGGTFGNISSFFTFKSSLLKENEELKAKLSAQEAQMSDHSALVDENDKLKEILNRKSTKADLTLSAILSRPNQSPYDTLVIDLNGGNVSAGDLVFALGNIPIGRISEVGANSSKVLLFSSSGEKTGVIIEGRNVSMELVGRGGGNFEMIVPRDFNLAKGATVTLPGSTPYVVGVVQTIISDPRDAFTRALLTSPANIFEQKFVQVQK